MGYDHELRGAMLHVFGSSLVCDTLEVAKEVGVVEEGMYRLRYGEELLCYFVMGADCKITNKLHANVHVDVFSIHVPH